MKKLFAAAIVVSVATGLAACDQSTAIVESLPKPSGLGSENLEKIGMDIFDGLVQALEDKDYEHMRSLVCADLTDEQLQLAFGIFALAEGVLGEFGFTTDKQYERAGDAIIIQEGSAFILPIEVSVVASDLDTGEIIAEERELTPNRFEKRDDGRWCSHA